MNPPSELAAKLDAETCYIYLARHGATDNNQAGVLQGQQDHPALSEQGLRQAAQLRDQLADRPIVAIYSSPLRRARQTAEIVATAHGLPVTTVDALMEVNVGRWEGRNWKDISATDAEAYGRFMENPAEYPYDGGETFTDVVARVKPALDALYERHLGKAIAVVAHSVVNRTYLATTLGIPLRLANRLTHQNCAINVLRRRRGNVQVVAMNSGFHLGEH